MQENGVAVQVETVFSRRLGIDWNCSAYLPSGYRLGDERYPVVYLLHGLYGNHGNFEDRMALKGVLVDLARRGLPPAIFVCVDGFNSFYIDALGGMQMERAIMEDLIPHIDTRYRTVGSRASRALCGISMGGFGSARLALRYPEVFSSAALISPAVWRERPGDEIYLTQHAFRDERAAWSHEVYRSVFPTKYLSARSAEVRFHIESGEKDGVVPIGEVDAFVGCLSDAGIPVRYVRDGEGAHEWAYWKDAVSRGLAWTLEGFSKEPS